MTQKIQPRRRPWRPVVKPTPHPASVAAELLRLFHDEDFEPKNLDDFQATGAAPGSLEKIEVMAKRVELGQPVWHPCDRSDFRGVNSTVKEA